MARLSSENEHDPDGVPKWLEKQYTPEQWEKLSVMEKYRIRQESKSAGSLSAATANDLLVKKGVQRSKSTFAGLPISPFPDLLVEDSESGVLRKVDLFEDEGLAADDDDTAPMTRGLPDWVVPKNRLLRSFFQFRTTLDARSEERFIRDSYMVFDDDPLMCAEPVNTPATPTTFTLPALKMTDFEWDDWKKEKRIPILPNANPAHPLMKDKKRPETVGKKWGLGRYWEHKMKPSEIASLASGGGLSDENPVFYYNTPGAAALQGREYILVPDYKRTSKLTRVAIAYLKKKGIALTEESIKERVDYLDHQLTKFTAALKKDKKEEATAQVQPSKPVISRIPEIGEMYPLDDPRTSLTPDLTQPISVAIPKEAPKSSSGTSPDSPSKRVLPARTRKPTLKEAERREDSQRLKAASRRSRGSKEREDPLQPSPAISTATSATAAVDESALAAESSSAATAASAESPEKDQAGIVPDAPSTVKGAPKKEEPKKPRLADKPRRRKGIGFVGDDVVDEEEEEEQVVGKTKDGENIVLVQRQSGWTIRFDKPAEASKAPKGIKHAKKPALEFEMNSSDEDEGAPSLDELTKLHPSELIIYRDRRGEVSLAPRCCLADVRDGAWVACKRPGRNDVMTATLAKRAYEMDLHIAWRYKAVNQRICQLHSRVIRNAGWGGDIMEEMLPWLGRRTCTDLEKQLVGGEMTTAFDELDKEETKWLNWEKPVSTHIFMQKMKEVNKEAYECLYNMKVRTVIRRRVKRVRRVRKGTKRRDRAFFLAKYFFRKIDSTNLTEEDFAALSGKERRALAELLRVNEMRIRRKKRARRAMIERFMRKRNIEYRPISPISLDSEPGSKSDFDMKIGPLIQCMVRRRKRNELPKFLLRQKPEKVDQEEKLKDQQQLKRTMKVTRNTVKGRLTQSKKEEEIGRLKSGELFNVTKYRTMRRGMTKILRGIKKSSPEKKLYAFESLLGKKVPGLKEVIEREPHQGRVSLLASTEYVTITLNLRRAKKEVKEDYTVIGILKDRAANRRTVKGRNPVLFLAYRKGEIGKTKQVVHLMPRLPRKAMKEMKIRTEKKIKPQPHVEIVDLTGPKELILKMRANEPNPIIPPHIVRRKVKKPMKKKLTKEEKKKAKALFIEKKLQWIKKRQEGIKAIEKKEKAAEAKRLAEERKAEKQRKRKEREARLARERSDEPMEIDDEVEFLGVTKVEKWVHPMLKEIEEEERAAREAQKKKVEAMLRKKQEEQKKMKKRRDPRLRLYLRPSVIVIRSKSTRSTLNKIKEICLQKMKDLPNFNKILDRIVFDSLKKACTMPEPDDESTPTVLERKPNTVHEKRRELWMEQIDHYLRVYGVLPPSVPVQYVEERREELEERIAINLEVEERLHYEEQRERLRDEVSAAEAAIDEETTDEEEEEEEEMSKAAREAFSTLNLAGQYCGPALPRTSGKHLLQARSVYDKLKDEKYYWTEKEDERWRTEKKFNPAPRRRRVHYTDDVYDEITNSQTLPASTCGKLTSVPEGAVLMETALTKSVKTGKKISVRRALRNIDVSSLTLAQMRKMIEGLKKMKTDRKVKKAKRAAKGRKIIIKTKRKRRPKKMRKQQDERIVVEGEPSNEEDEMIIVKYEPPKQQDETLEDAPSTSFAPVKKTKKIIRNEAEPSTSTAPFKKPKPFIPTQSDAAALLEWSMAALCVEEVEKELRDNGEDVRTASREQVRRSIGRLKKLKRSVYEQLRPLVAVNETEPTTIKIRELQPAVQSKPQKAIVKTEGEKKKQPATIKLRSVSSTGSSVALQKSAVKGEKMKKKKIVKFEEKKPENDATVKKIVKKSEKEMKGAKEEKVNGKEITEKKKIEKEKVNVDIKSKTAQRDKKEKKEKKQQVKSAEASILEKTEKTIKKKLVDQKSSTASVVQPKSEKKEKKIRYNWDAANSSTEPRLFLVKIHKTGKETTDKTSQVIAATKAAKVEKRKEFSKKDATPTENKTPKKEKKDSKKTEVAVAPDKDVKVVKKGRVESKRSSDDAEIVFKKPANPYKEKLESREAGAETQKRVAEEKRARREAEAKIQKRATEEKQAPKKAEIKAKKIVRLVKRPRTGYESDASREDERRYRRQKIAARKGRKEMMKMGEETEEEEEVVEKPKVEVKKRSKRKQEEQETLIVDGEVVAKKRRKQVDPTGFTLLPTRSIYRYRDRFGLPKEEGDTRAALVFGAQHHFKKLEGSASAIPYFVQALKSGGNYLDEKDARQFRRTLEAQRKQAEQLAAAGLQPETPPPTRGTRYRVAANQQKQLVKEAENKEASVNDDDSQ